MGQHSTPKYYLSGFSDLSDPNCIWVYEKASKQEPRLQPIVVTASENKRWPESLETFLANKIEAPANTVLDKIRNQQLVTKADKEVLSDYMVVMLKRVDKGLKRAKEIAPKVIPDTFDYVKNEILRLINDKPEKADSLNKSLEELDNLRTKYEDEFPIELWYKNITPDTPLKLSEFISSMRWVFLTTDENSPFLTSDNPVFYFEWMGIGKQDSEITFPISSTIALHATWNMNFVEGYFNKATAPIIKEINRRTASAATRFLYFSKKEKWVQSMLDRKTYRLNRIK